jgi:hypothetical protein
MKYRENPSNGSRDVLRGQTDMTKLIDAFRNFTNLHKNKLFEHTKKSNY